MQDTSPPQDDYFVSTIVPVIKTAPPPRKSYFGVIFLVIVIGGIGAFVFAVTHQGSGPKAAPEALAPKPARAGVPHSLEDAVRIQAEANRHAALQTIEQANTSDPHTLEGAQPNFRWVDGTTASDGPAVVSVAGTGTKTIVAVSASNHDVCAFGRWSGLKAEYVTMAHLPACRAVDAPTAGWTGEAGGAPSDIPDDIANS